MKTKKLLPFLTIFFSLFAFNALAVDITIIKENKAGFWGFNDILEQHVEGVSTLKCGGEGFAKPQFTLVPSGLDADLKTINKFIKKVFKKIDHGKASGTFEKKGLFATWKTLDDGTTEISIKS